MNLKRGRLGLAPARNGCKGGCGLRRSLNLSGYCVSCWLEKMHPAAGRELRAQAEKFLSV
jgi:hypothetical protein